jgi:hypothetical protein
LSQKTLALKMKIKRKFLLNTSLFFLIASALCITKLNAQIRNKIVSGEKQSEVGALSVKASRMRNYELPNIDVKNLLKEDSLERTQGKPFRFGKAVEVDIDFIREATKLTIGDSSIFFYRISSKKAYSINLIFDRFSLANNASLEIYNYQKTMIYGPVTSKDNPSNGVFWTDLIKGESIIIQLTVIGKDTQQTSIHIGKVIHGYQNTFAGFGQSANCNRDIACPEGNLWRNEGNAVAMLLLANGQRFCTGSLLNNACQDFTPNFLTAFHCLDSDANGALSTNEQNSVNNWVFRFLYESPTCGGGDGATFQSINGSVFRSAFQPSDFALLLLNARPTGNVTYAGWSRANIPATSAATIHHPNGDVKKISIDNDALTNVAVLTAWGNGVTCPPNTHWQTIFDPAGGAIVASTVQPGSSGSPIFDQNRRVVGQLHGDFLNTNNDFCTNRRGHYGRFDVSWNGGGTATTQLGLWLTNDPNVTQTNTVAIPFITGPNLICTSDVFTLTNQSAGSTVSWSSSNQAGLSINATGTATRQNSFNGQVTVSAIANSGAACGNVVFTTNVTVGTPTPTGIIGPDYDLCRDRGSLYVIGTYSIDNPLPGVTYQWQVVTSSGQTSPAGSGTSISLNGARYPLGCHTIRVRSNSCSTFSPWYESTFCVIDCAFRSFNNSQALYPNPASDDVTVILGSDSLESQVHSLKLVNRYQEVVYEKTTEKTQITIPVSKLPEGTYYLSIKNKDGVLQRRVLIKH